MKYIILGKDEKEYGPVDGDTLQKWVEHGRVLPDTQVRNAMIKKWNKAEELDFLKEAFSVQTEHREEEAGFLDRTKELLDMMSGKKKAGKKEQTAFRYTYVHQPAAVFQRVSSVVFDGIIFGAFAFMLLLLLLLAFKAGYNPNGIFHLFFVFFIGGIMLYYVISLGIYAQTVGMWFWGILIVRHDVEEVFMGRAFLFTVLMLLLGILSPVFTYVNPKKRSLHGLLSGCMVIKVAAKPKS